MTGPWRPRCSWPHQAAAASDWEAAQMHYEAAIQLAEQLPHLIEQADARRFYAQMLLDRAGPDDHDQAQTLIGEAVDRYERIGMPRHAVMARSLLGEP